MMETKRRAHVWITGRVQGVFFRLETQQAAIAQGLVGWVRNLPDGRVEAVFEGNAADVEAMVNWCWKGAPRASVLGVEWMDEPVSGQYGAFDIVR